MNGDREEDYTNDEKQVRDRILVKKEILNEILEKWKFLDRIAKKYIIKS